MRAFWKLQLLALAVIGCAKAGVDPSKKDGPKAADLQVTEMSGSIAINVAKDSNIHRIRGYVLGSPIMHRLDTPNAHPLGLVFTAIKPGSYDVIVHELSEDATHAIRINGITVSSGKTSRVNVDQIFAVKSISGVVRDINGNGVTAKIKIPGTDIETTADSSGNYQLNQVPAGKHTLEFSADGFKDGKITGLHLTQETNLSLEPMLLHDADASVPSIAPAVRDGKANTLKVPFLLLAPKDADQVRISEKKNFIGAKWQPYASTMYFEFKDPGEKEVFAQFSKNGNNLSDILFTTVAITIP